MNDVDILTNILKYLDLNETDLLEEHVGLGDTFYLKRKRDIEYLISRRIDDKFWPGDNKVLYKFITGSWNKSYNLSDLANKAITQKTLKPTHGIDILYLLIDAKVNCDLALRTACSYNRADIVELLLTVGRFYQILQVKITDVLKQLMLMVMLIPLVNDERVNPSIDNDYCLTWASRRGNIEVVKILMEDLEIEKMLSDMQEK